MDLHDALSRIAEIRSRVAATERFQGYRALPIACTGGLAVLAALGQSRWVPQPAEHLLAYLGLWLGVAILGLVAAAQGIWLRHRNGANRLSRELTFLAVGQFLPCLMAGGIATVAIAFRAPEHGILLPGLWQLFFSLGIFASWRLLPRPIGLVGAFYMLCGTSNLLLAGHGLALQPWSMGLPFGLGQLGTAAILYWNLERGRHDETE